MVGHGRLILHTPNPVTCGNVKVCRVCRFQRFTPYVRARIAHARPGCKHIGGCEGLCRVWKSIRECAPALAVKLWTRHTLHTSAISAGQAVA